MLRRMQQSADGWPWPQQGHNTEQQDMGDDLIWFQSSMSVKGLTETSSQPVDVGGFM